MASALSLKKLSQLRTLMRAHKLAAYIVPTADAHQSEYVSARDGRRAFISDFTGSAGTAVITADAALLWTDGRYFLQAERQLSEHWKLMKDRLPETPPVEKWLATTLRKGDVIGIDARLFALATSTRMKGVFEKAGLLLSATTTNLVDDVWGSDQPPAPCAPVIAHPVQYAGVSAADKLARVRAEMAKEGADSLILAACDEVCWTFNIRGGDVECNPVVLAFATITGDSATLFVEPTKVSADVARELGEAGITIRPYEEAASGVTALPGRIWLDASSCNYALYQAALAPEPTANISAEIDGELPSAASNGGVESGVRDASTRVLQKMNPVQLLKSVKNEREIEGMRSCHIRDAVALTTFLAWLECAVTTGMDARSNTRIPAPLTEFSAGAVLDGMRALQPLYVSLSFPTIAGMGPNGAIIHYHAEEATAAEVTASGLFLLDSGGQYRDGTTDVTRTVHMGTPTPAEKAAFTRVLQGHIALLRAVFPTGASGVALDAIARAPLWAAGMDYRHGTGHGVGSFLNVHEGPQGAATVARSAYEGGMVNGMTLTDEPGYYADGQFGIRIESVLIARPNSATECSFGTSPWLQFESFTVVPISPKCVDAALLSVTERGWLDAYNARVRSVLEPLLKDEWALAYLRRETQPLSVAAE